MGDLVDVALLEYCWLWVAAERQRLLVMGCGVVICGVRRRGRREKKNETMQLKYRTLVQISAI